MKNGSPDYHSSATPYVSPRSVCDHSTMQPTRPLPFQDRSGPRYTTTKFCKECSAALTDTWKLCPMCGTVPETPVKLVSLKPTRCVCGKTIQDDYKFCPSCAQPIDESWKDKPTCSCGVIFTKDAKHCVGCGKKIQCSSHRPLSGQVTSRRARRNTRQS